MDRQHDLIIAGPDKAPAWVVLAHGAGAPMTSPVMQSLADGLCRGGLRVVRFEFDYMAARRLEGSRRPPPRIDKLETEYLVVLADVRRRMAASNATRLLIGGKSMGGRLSSLIADRLYADGAIAGWFAIGYPFHPAGRPEKLRTGHLANITCPGLIVQGERDRLGSRDEIAAYQLSPRIGIVWSASADHDLKPLKSSGCTHEGSLAEAAKAVAEFALHL